MQPAIVSPAKRADGQHGGVMLVLLVVLCAVVLVAAGYLWFVLHWSYSEGDRAGVLLKFSRKGWVCKTWEGELAQYVVPGMAPNIWQFSVRDRDAAEKLRSALGRHVVLHYEEHRGIPTSCFGETNYFVREVRLGAAPTTPD